MCDRKCRKEGFKFYDLASRMVEDDGEPHTFEPLLDMLQFMARRKEGISDERQAMEDLLSRNPEANCRLASGVRGVDNKMWACYAAKKMFAIGQKLDSRVDLLRERNSLHLPGFKWYHDCRNKYMQLFPLGILSAITVTVVVVARNQLQIAVTVAVAVRKDRK